MTKLTLKKNTVDLQNLKEALEAKNNSVSLSMPAAKAQPSLPVKPAATNTVSEKPIIPVAATPVIAQQKAIPLNKNPRVQDALNWLCKSFPNAFHLYERKPLKIGILADIFGELESAQARVEKTQHAETQAAAAPTTSTMDTEESSPSTSAKAPHQLPTKTAVRDALIFFTNGITYLQAMTSEGAFRLDLSGADCGAVTKEEQAYSAEKLQKTLVLVNNLAAQNRKKRKNYKAKKSSAVTEGETILSDTVHGACVEDCGNA